MISWLKRFGNNTLDRFGIAGELIRFFWSQKLWWLVPVVVCLLIFAALIIFAQGAAVTPFVYTFF
ncbi:MAG: hypothetical protein A3F33_00810 [Candidatus Woykebacteria bacterium RIFCSPHIGHO2_12_FULL_43_10]|uniref:Uncharacterized protein n=1 Tax=Candidatus Woykebacteria bacterium RIFCSPLOWO2_01_FULL_43_14 TaxID=1802605 RepID=A0A1G1WYV6_9BACT|nr:MAG: hypothetical protein A2802_01280 [Candidatus Woykebacteria bacterium RIFCSPHIGHO2_01_FULL_43_29]OGY29013.1 MAG: hypothetical protein A3F33_00810 [Candidatus Woykebacteria bacterium RIFCSPHIGHO2_12_FULL_43_10]OGY32894.1 MAG: hypothetical protein A3A61_02650 [Candidatus Woykebacteria bacterium RIFCSPLOWO2_01_FULL_43_14]